MFFPCWLTNNPYQKLFYQALNEHFDLAVEGYDQKGLRKELIDRKKDKFKFIHLHWLHNFFDFKDPSVLENTIEALSYAKQNGFEIILLRTIFPRTILKTLKMKSDTENRYYLS